MHPAAAHVLDRSVVEETRQSGIIWHTTTPSRPQYASYLVDACVDVGELVGYSIVATVTDPLNKKSTTLSPHVCYCNKTSAKSTTRFKRLTVTDSKNACYSSY